MTERKPSRAGESAALWKKVQAASAVGAGICFAGVFFPMKLDLERNWVVFWGICLLANLVVFMWAPFRRMKRSQPSVRSNKKP